MQCIVANRPAFRHPVPCPARIGQIQANVPHFQQLSQRIYFFRIFGKTLQTNDISASDYEMRNYCIAIIFNRTLLLLVFIFDCQRSVEMFRGKKRNNDCQEKVPAEKRCICSYNPVTAVERRIYGISC